MPGLPGIDEIAALGDGGGEPPSERRIIPLSGKSSSSSDTIPSVGFGSIGGKTVTIEGVGLDEARDIGKPFLGDQPRPARDIEVAIVAQQDRQRLDRLSFDGFERIAPMTGGNVGDADIGSLLRQELHCPAHQLLDMDLALPDAAPAD